jgi:hypothetical protein
VVEDVDLNFELWVEGCEINSDWRRMMCLSWQRNPHVNELRTAKLPTSCRHLYSLVQYSIAELNEERLVIPLKYLS